MDLGGISKSVVTNIDFEEPMTNGGHVRSIFPITFYSCFIVLSNYMLSIW